jgi:Rieske Fe-S protein
MAKSPHLTRNEFVKTMVAVVGTVMGVVVGLPAIGYLVGPFLKVSSSDVWIPLGPLENYPIGTPPTLFSFTRTKINGWERTTNSYGVLVYRKTDAETIVFSNVCTHLACRVKWERRTRFTTALATTPSFVQRARSSRVRKRDRWIATRTKLKMAH